MLNKVMYVFVALVLITGVARLFVAPEATAPTVPGEINCPEVEEKICWDGSMAERQGMSCAYECPPEISPEVRAMIDAKSDLITLSSPVPNETIESPLHVAGKARGNWFFEGSFPITVNGVIGIEGVVLGQGIAQAQGEWMTDDFVTFVASIDWAPVSGMEKEGVIILHKDNPSGLLEHDDSLEIPVRFAP